MAHTFLKGFIAVILALACPLLAEGKGDAGVIILAAVVLWLIDCLRRKGAASNAKTAALATEKKETVARHTNQSGTRGDAK